MLFSNDSLLRNWNKEKELSSVEKAMPSRILITGVTGFVGSYLVQRCLTHYPQAELYGLCNRKMPQTALPVMKQVRPLQADITQPQEVRQAVAQSRPDLIFHLAAQSSVVASWANPMQTLQINAIGTLHLLEALRSEQLTPRVLLVGSGEQYGLVPPQENPIHENCPLRPVNPYAISKATQDLYGYQYFVAYGLPILRTRSFNHFGPRQADTFVVASFARRIALIETGKAEPVLQVGNLQAQRDFLPVEDVVAAYLAIAERGQPGEVYNVGSGKTRSIREILDHLLALTDTSIDVSEDAARLRPLDMPILTADISRLHNHTGWKPLMCFELALKETLDYWRYVVTTTM
jgi:GDP-4-dehydro-6-deoxy-D-mannose reductase